MVSRRYVFLMVYVLSATAAAAQVPETIFDGIARRDVGPAIMAGRVTDFAVYEDDPSIFYVASAGGGLLKTTNGGNTWENVFDSQATVSIGDVAINPDRSQRRMGRHGRSEQPPELLVGRRHLQVDRRRQDVEAHGPPRVAAHRPHRESIRRTPTSSTSRRSAGCGARTRSAASTRPPTAASRGSRCSPSTRTPAPWTS